VRGTAQKFSRALGAGAYRARCCSRLDHHGLWITGDLTWGIPTNSSHPGRIFVPISAPSGANASCHIGIFDANLSFHYPPAGLGQDQCPWLAFNTTNGLFYTYEKINGVSRLKMYKISAGSYNSDGTVKSASVATRVNQFGVADSSFALTIKGVTGGSFAFANTWVQGGAFRVPADPQKPRNKLYMSVQSTKTTGTNCETRTGTGNKCTGIYVLDVINGRVAGFTHVSVGDVARTGSDAELEGLAVVRKTQGSYYVPSGDCSSGCSSDVHLVIGNNDINNDSMSIRHYSADTLGSL
jgi:hypothetical protein